MQLGKRLCDLPHDTIVHLGTDGGSGYVRIETAAWCNVWVTQHGWRKREIIDEYPMIADPGIAIIVEGDEKGRYWFLSEVTDGVVKSGGI